MNGLWVLALLGTIAVALRGEPGRAGSLPLLDDPDTVTASLPDTVRMLVFPAFSPRRVEAESRGGVRVNGTVVRRAVIEVAGESGLLVDGKLQDVPFSIVPARKGDSLILTIPQRRRGFAARLTLLAAEGQLKIVAHLPLRDYLAATLAAETSSDDPPAYLAALAAVQRNFLLLHTGRHAPLAEVCDNTHCQAANPERITPRVWGAVAAAERIELGDGAFRPAFYAACCGGGTLTPAQVWGTPAPGYTSVPCNNCRRSSRYRWENSVPVTPSVEALLRALPAPPFVNDDLRIGLGRLVGFNRVPGNTFERIVRRGREYRITGRGFGHRVGLCQEGARTLARNGWSAERILHYYFPSARLAVREEKR